MRYSQFKIRNFKGIKDITLDLDKNQSKVFTLVGLNESGKTTVLEALNLFQEDYSEDERHLLIPKSLKDNFSDFISVEATLALDEQDEKEIAKFCEPLNFYLTKPIEKIVITKSYEFKNSKFQDKSNSWRISLVGKAKRAKKNRTLNAKDDEWQKAVAHIRDNLLPPIIYYKNFLFDFPEKIYVYKQGTDAKQEFYHQVLQDVLDSIGSNQTIDTHIVERMKSSANEDKEALEATISKMSGIITQKVFGAWKYVLKGKDKTKDKEIILKPGKEMNVQNTEDYYIEMALKDGYEKYPISERSLGFKWFFSFLLFTEFRKNRETDKGQILFLLDEPASNLHSTAQKNLLETFEQLVSSCSLIYTTHSHHLINPKWLEGAYIIKNNALTYENEIAFDTAKTDIVAEEYRHFVSKYPDQTEYFKPILDTLDYQPGLLEKVPNIIVIEGKHDFYAFKYVNEVILDNKYSLGFYPGGGAGKNSQVVSLYLAWSRDFSILMDSDKAGRDAKTNYIQEYGKIIEDKVFTYNDIETTWNNFKVESLFSEKDRTEILQRFFPKQKKFSKPNFHLAIQNLLVDNTEIELENETIENFEKVFAFLNTNSHSNEQ